MRTAFGSAFDVPVGYLNTASIGVPPVAVASEVAAAVTRWGSGVDSPDAVDKVVTVAREAFGRLVGVPANRVAGGASVGQMVAMVAASLPLGARVLVAEGDFTSLTFPFAARGLQVTEVPLDGLVAAAAGYDLVAVSVVQSADGRIADLDGLRATGVPVLLDASQAVGWLPLSLEWADWTVAAGYKWLMSPRGCAWLACSPRGVEAAVPVAANWWAGEDPWTSVYGLPLRLASDARRLDISPVWLSQFGAAAALPYVASLDMAAVRDHNVGLADSLLAGMGMEPRGSAIVSLSLSLAEVGAGAGVGGGAGVGVGRGVGERLAAAGVRSAVRAGRVRLGFHLYNTAEDVDLVLEALR
ncbi:aminotransferase class V-fold PLP-dependent enzyme [Actinosynnema sp. NPDC047251]|uniref:Aminotransferase class V n=1 Tax=Saccharothrix espanaensis (strain ATCC 51144 / DSM 44229 / JCM 9112 / NBRC 15066 / NRRL 15764) TaxID=1179773 RepID=K0K1W8_SACES|nr:aminotransferase class V-fold PLP-dependent enzyme [Saccharothrix espanaensis]CCH34225.1 Aminotransferase class V [Saccharothrix espanaensis DSM 44229]